MTETSPKRKLAAILHADVVGYSRLMGEDEAGTHRTLRQFLDAITATINDYQGRVVNYSGDAVLADFTTVTDALSAAVSIQNDINARNQALALPKERQIQFRIGVHLGEVIIDGEDIYGDGVNIAARLESLAEAGGICISESARSAIGSKLELTYQDMGEHEIKNIARPVRVYQVLPAGTALAIATAGRRRLSVRASIAVALLMLAVAGGSWWWLHSRDPVTSDGKYPQQHLSDKPSIAVLPFDNLSGNPEQDYFGKALAEDLITDLSKLRGLTVIARNSSFSLEGQSLDARWVGEKLGVRYLVEGSVRKSGKRLRVNAQLIDTASGDHLWAERWDRPDSDIFAVQDELTGKIVSTLDVKLSEGEQSRRWRGQTDDPVAYDLYLRGRARKLEESREGISAAIPLLEEAVSRDPDFAAPWVWLGWAYFAHDYMGWAEDRDAYRRKAIDAANKAIAADPYFGDPHALLSELASWEDDFERATLEAEKAVELDPGNADNWGFLAVRRIEDSRPDEGYEAIQRALRINPIPPAWYHNVHGQALLALKRYAEAETAFGRCIKMAPEFVTCYRYLTATHLEAGNLEAARHTARDVLRIVPDYNITTYETWHKHADPKEQKRRIELLKSAGLPE